MSIAEPTYSSFETVTASGASGDLTARECQVVALVAQGCTDRAIAARLGLSLSSVEGHVRAGYLKIGITRRTQAVIWWWFESSHRVAVGLIEAE